LALIPPHPQGPFTQSPFALGREAERPKPMVPNACTGRQLVGSSFFFFCQCYSHHLVCANQQLRTGSFLDAASQCVWAEASMYSPLLFSIFGMFSSFRACLLSSVNATRSPSCVCGLTVCELKGLVMPTRGCGRQVVPVQVVVVPYQLPSAASIYSKSWRCDPWLQLWELRWHRAVPAQSSR